MTLSEQNGAQARPVRFAPDLLDHALIAEAAQVIWKKTIQPHLVHIGIQYLE